MKKEFSAGGIVYKKIRNPKSEIRKDKVMWLVCQHSQHKGWVFPKGLIGDTKAGELREDTAVREVEEETGIKAMILRELSEPAKYFFVFKGEKRLKTVYYFLMEHIGGDINKHDHEMSAVEWVETERVLEKLTYKSDKKAFIEALQIYSNLRL